MTGVDFSRTGLDKARHLARQRHVTAEWILADVTTYRPAPAALDLVTILYLQLPAEPLAADVRPTGDGMSPPSSATFTSPEESP